VWEDCRGLRWRAALVEGLRCWIGLKGQGDRGTEGTGVREQGDMVEKGAWRDRGHEVQSE